MVRVLNLFQIKKKHKNILNRDALFCSKIPWNERKNSEADRRAARGGRESHVAWVPARAKEATAMVSFSIYKARHSGAKGFDWSVYEVMTGIGHFAVNLHTFNLYRKRETACSSIVL